MSEKIFVICEKVAPQDAGSLTAGKEYEVAFIDESGDIHVVADDLGNPFVLTADDN